METGDQQLTHREGDVSPVSPNEEWKWDKKSCKKDSMDSGIAGLREPHFNSNSKSCSACTDNDSSETEVSSGITTYVKGRFLGKGGFAHVHELVDLSTNTVYAGKIIPKDRITKPHHMQKIAREISIHRSLVHNNVVRLHHFFEDKVNVYIVLENCSRKSLLHVLKHRYTVSEPEARYYLRQMVEGVKYIHSQKVIHRDLKPGNMFLSGNMVVKLGDFGLATLVDGNKKVSICGTPNYIAPEVLNKLSYSYEADVWAIGCILYAMLIGQPPFETASLKETYYRIVNNKYVVPGHVSVSAQKLIKELLQPQPEERISLASIGSHEYFTSYTPNVLSPSCCYTSPTFSSNLLKGQSNTSLQAASSSSNQNKKQNNNLSAHIKSDSQKNNQTTKTTLKQKITNILKSDKSEKKEQSNAATLYHILMFYLRKMPVSCVGNENANSPVVVCSPVLVSKWIDYSNKYGFAFQLSDKSVGVLFNDDTRIGYSPDKSRVEFRNTDGKVSAHPEHSVPSALQKRFMLLKYFTQYMEEHLTDGGDVEADLFDKNKCIPYMKRWVRTSTAIIMELNNGTLQINFFRDHTKIIVSAGKHGYLVTYINSDRQSRSYWLHQLGESGCDKEINNRLRFAAAVLREFAELDGDDI